MSPTTHWRSITMQSLPVLTGTVLVGILAGQVLQASQEHLLTMPILLAMVPAVNGVIGNVGSILGSRVASGLHLGSLWSNRARGFRRDLAAGFLLSAVAFTFLGLFAGLAGPMLGVPGDYPMGRLVATAFVTGMVLMLCMVLLVILVGMLSHRYGWDPDNVVVPVLTTAGDALGILFLILTWNVIKP